MISLEVLRARFWTKVNRETGACWLWTGWKSKDGYGKMRMNGSVVYAHRLSFVLFVGELGADIVMHKCDNPACVRPSHLERGDYSENLAECWSRGRRPIPIWLPRIKGAPCAND